MSDSRANPGWTSGATHPRVVVVGAGGMGALFGAILQAGGIEVSLVDIDRDHVEAIRCDGLRITGFAGDRVVAIPATENAADIRTADVVLFQCKAHGTLDAARAVHHLVESGAICVSFQNGLGNEEAIAGILGSENVLGGLTTMGGYKTGPGRIRDFARVPTYLGEMQGGLSARSTALSAAFTAAGLPTHASADIVFDIWRKLLGNIAMSAVSGLSGLTLREARAVTELERTSIRALDEALAIAAGRGIVLDRKDALDGLDTITRPGGTGENRSSLAVDILNRRETEVDVIYGTVIAYGRDLGIATPTLETLASLVKGVESGFGHANDRTEEEGS